MDKPKVAAIIQARMGSSRLPGKVLMSIAGKPVLWHIIHRLRKCRNVDVIAIATSEKATDDPVVEFARTENVIAIRGPEENVLQRYFLAAAQIDPDVIVRVTGDAPLVDPGLIDELVGTLIREDADYCCGDPSIPSIHEGFSPFSRRALNRLLNEASDDPVAIEHVTAYFKEHPEKFRCVHFVVPKEHRFHGTRMSVDTPADLRFMNELYARLGVPAGEAEIAEVVRILNEQPDLLNINSHIYQKKSKDKALKFLVRCDGDSQIGLGHAVRCLALADELREKHGCGVTFAMTTGELGVNMVREAGFPIERQPADFTEEQWMDSLITNKRPHALILDVRSSLAREKVAEWRKSGILMATLDDPSNRRLEVDLAFYPPVPQVKRMDWTGFTGKLYCGWEWVILRSEFAAWRRKHDCLRTPHSVADPKPPNILVTMGGSDPAALTLKAVKALKMLSTAFHVTIILGRGFTYHAELKELIAGASYPFTINENVTDMVSIMSQADMAIASFGVTAYELAFMGVPTIFICLTEDHAEAASAFMETGMAVSLGTFTDVQVETIAKKTGIMLNNKSMWHELSNKTKKLIDGQGASRISCLLLERLKTGNG